MLGSGGSVKGQSRGLVRRAFLGIGIGALLGVPTAMRLGAAQEAPEEAPPPTDEETIEILTEESDPSFAPKATIGNFWFQEAEGARPSPHWPADDVSYDYLHLGDLAQAGVNFELTPAILDRSARLHRLPLRQDPVTLFGLRGCVLAEGTGSTSFAPSHAVVTARPDHLNLRCLIGVWRRSDDQIALFSASTVPNVDLMDGYVKGALGCNMMPTGLHAYRVGPHRGSRQPGALRQQQPLFVLRSPKNLGYAANDPDDIWDDLNGGLPFDNIHAAMLDRRGRPPFFSSAGCQVVAGGYAKGVPNGPWAKFRIAAGLAHPPVSTGPAGQTAEDGKRFQYFLLTGDEVRVAGAEDLTVVPTRRYGSAGQEVALLQERLGLPKDGSFGRGTLGALLIWQRENDLPMTGILDPAQAAALGIEMTPS